tara:strand:+ start:328 stop:786 length:459 start_codon:yes stop_codon:yes gene_type:complete
MNLNILYATVTGNAEMVAKKLENLASEEGFETNLAEMNDYTVKSFSQLENVAIITSTYGDGDVPEMGADFWDELSKSNDKLNDIRYGLIALGDRSHEQFCGAGKKISKKLDSLKCKKVIDNLECDGDTEGSYEWSIKFLKKLKSQSHKDEEI